jgi:hypothetical protein
MRNESTISGTTAGIMAGTVISIIILIVWFCWPRVFPPTIPSDETIKAVELGMNIDDADIFAPLNAKIREGYDCQIKWELIFNYSWRCQEK